MSGICGLVDLGGGPVTSEIIEALIEPVAYRGPDGIRHHILGEAGLAHLALHATPQAALEEQPLTAADGKVCIVVDARLDDRRDLAEQLELDVTLGDARLILEAYLCWGKKCPEHLLGDFAFAIWDRRRRELFCACDPLGLKSLHYAQVGALLCFATEAQQLLRHPAVSRRLDELSLGLYLCGELHLESGRTMFESVRRLPAAHRLVMSAAGLRVERYWDVDLEKRTVYRRQQDYADHFRELLNRVVADRLRASGDVIGVAMSGGLDSTSVTALAHRSLGTFDGPRLLAASFVFDQLKDCDESRYIRTMAVELELEVETIQAERHWALGDPEVWRPSLESPLMGWDGCFHELYRRLRERGARVVLTGNAGDEMLGGVLVLDRIWQRWWLNEAVAIVRRSRRHGYSLAGAIYHYWGSRLLPGWADRGLRRMLGKAPAPPTVPAWVDRDFARRNRLVDWFRQDAASWKRSSGRRGLRQIVRHPGASWTERTAARFGLEARHPFLDRRLVEFLLAIPLEQLIEVDCYKPLLRRSMKGVLPELVRQRPDKSQLGSFMDFGLRDKEAHQVQSLLRNPIAAELGFLNREHLKSAFQEYISGTPDASKRRLWYALTVELWLRQHRTFLSTGRPTIGARRDFDVGTDQCVA